MKTIRFFCMGIVTCGLDPAVGGKNFAAGPKYPTKPIQVVVAFCTRGDGRQSPAFHR